jgi:oxygen-dependent protoporphyrinogen oxidase
MIWSLLTEPVFKGFFSGVLFELTREARPANLEDESVASFLNRRLGNPHIGNNIVSAVLHGIYAGDIYQLSAKSLLRKMWEQERQHGSLTAALASELQNKTVIMTKKDLDLFNEISPNMLSERMKRTSVYTFKEGMGSLSKALESSLRENLNVEFKTGEKVTSVDYDVEKDGIKVCLPRSSPYRS